MSLLARKYLQISATSASSKRFFSQEALIINKQRNRLNKDVFEYIIFLKSWNIFKDEEEKENEEENENEEEKKDEIIKENDFII